MGSKEIVKRLTVEENDLINQLRDKKVIACGECDDKLYELLIRSGIYRTVDKILGTDTIVKFEDLRGKGHLLHNCTDSDLKELRELANSGKNIVCVGRIGVGKTTLLASIVNESKESGVTLALGGGFGHLASVENMTYDDCSIDMILNIIMASDVERVVITELLRKREEAILTMLLGAGKTVHTTMHTALVDITSKMDIINQYERDNCFSKHTLDFLRDENTVMIYCDHYVDGERSIQILPR